MGLRALSVIYLSPHTFPVMGAAVSSVLQSNAQSGRGICSWSWGLRWGHYGLGGVGQGISAFLPESPSHLSPL